MQRKPIRCTQCKVCAEKIHQSGWWCTALEVASASPPSWTQADYHLLTVYRWTKCRALKSRVVQIIKLIKSARPRALMRSSNNCLLLVKSKISKVQRCGSKHFLPQHINCLIYFLSTSFSFLSQGKSFKLRFFYQKPFSCRSSGSLSEWK